MKAEFLSRLFLLLASHYSGRLSAVLLCSLVLDNVLTKFGVVCLSLWLWPLPACEVLQHFPADLEDSLRERSGLFLQSRRGQRKKFSIICRGGSGNTPAESLATPSPRDSTSHTGSRLVTTLTAGSKSQHPVLTHITTQFRFTRIHRSFLPLCWLTRSVMKVWKFYVLQWI